ncbi:MAG: hypothetical protein E7597_04180 [Ruminococcaceae bacterium]|nr:hypothetical protein [Oscillospiraceae bacterium]
MKKILCLMLALIMLAGCTPVNMEEDESKTESRNESKTESISTPESVSESEPDEESSTPDESSAATEGYQKPEILDKSYSERSQYFGEYWNVEYDVNDTYFKNSVFVGNSIMLHFSKYTERKRAADKGFLGNANFFAAASFSYYNNAHQTADSKDCALPSFRGQPMNITQAVGEMNIGTVYLSLMALNDIAIYKDGMTGILETYDLFVKLIDELKTEYPAVKVVVLSNTYLHSSSDNAAHKLNNGSISDLNIRVLDYCNQNGIDFIDIASVLLDEDDCLGTEFCSDVGSPTAACHLTDYAYNAWTFILRDYAANKLAGTWENPESMKGIISK